MLRPTTTCKMSHRGRKAHASGLAAERQVARHYQRLGFSLREHRWRGAAGEIDLILSDGSGVVFVEVKSASDFEAAAASLQPAQIGRISRAASEYLGRLPDGELSPARIDVALVHNGGAIDILENAIGH